MHPMSSTFSVAPSFTTHLRAQRSKIQKVNFLIYLVKKEVIYVYSRNECVHKHLFDRDRNLCVTQLFNCRQIVSDVSNSCLTVDRSIVMYQTAVRLSTDRQWWVKQQFDCRQITSYVSNSCLTVDQIVSDISNSCSIVVRSLVMYEMSLLSQVLD